MRFITFHSAVGYCLSSGLISCLYGVVLTWGGIGLDAHEDVQESVGLFGMNALKRPSEQIVISIIHCTVIVAKLENEDEWFWIADSFIRDCKSEGISFQKFRDEWGIQQMKATCYKTIILPSSLYYLKLNLHEQLSMIFKQ